MRDDPNAPGGFSRRRAMKCLMWGSAGVLWTLDGGVPKPFALGSGPQGAAQAAPTRAFRFGQISDSHIGFKAPANPDPPGTLAAALTQLSAGQPSFLIHTGDVSHLSRPEQFDTAAEIMKQSRREVFYVPGEHDTIGDDGRLFFQRFGRARTTGGWYSFDSHGVHFIGLVNVVGLKPGGLGTLGAAQRQWLEDDLRGRSSSTPLVIFAHMPLWSIYPQWGWGTDDAAAALSHVQRFGSVTVLNGHIHQVIQKVEGDVTYHTACSTAFPQPTPGHGPGPMPLAVPAGELRSMLGVRQVEFIAGRVRLADATLADRPGAAIRSQVTIRNYSFLPGTLTIGRGTTVVWINRDGDAHTITSSSGPGKFQSPGLDTGETFAFTFDEPGTYRYFCSVHPYMRGTVIVRDAESHPASSRGSGGMSD